MMSAAVVMRASAVGLGALGLALLFAPVELSGLFGWGGSEAAGSLAAGGLLAVAVLNWTGRGAAYGGIFGRPVILANLVLALTAGLPLLKRQLAGGAPAGWVPAVLLLLHGLAFGRLLMSPTPTGRESATA